MSMSSATITPRPMLHALAKNWWLLLIRGIASIVFGVLAFAWPGLTLVTLVLFYGAFALVDGVIALAAAFKGSAKPVPTWWLVVVGLLGIAAGIATFVMPGLAAVRSDRADRPGRRCARPRLGDRRLFDRVRHQLHRAGVPVEGPQPRGGSVAPGIPTPRVPAWDA